MPKTVGPVALGDVFLMFEETRLLLCIKEPKVWTETGSCQSKIQPSGTHPSSFFYLFFEEGPEDRYNISVTAASEDSQPSGR